MFGATGAVAAARGVPSGITLWLGLLALGSLGLMGAFVRWGLPSWSLQAWAVLNPVEAYRLACLAVVDADLDLLEPAGAALLGRLGRGGLVTAGVVSLASWSRVAYLVGRCRFDAAGG